MGYSLEDVTISIHAPIVGCDGCIVLDEAHAIKFQSTHPSWGATGAMGYSLEDVTISIHAPIVGCDNGTGLYKRQDDEFQSTHPSWGATTKQNLVELSLCLFQSTHPSWGATTVIHNDNYRLRISIHAPIVGCDISLIFRGSTNQNFNPRTHRGVRLLNAESEEK